MPIRKFSAFLFALAISFSSLAGQNALYLDTLDIKAGESALCRLHLRNVNPVRSVQFDLVMDPAGALTYLRMNKLDVISTWTLSSSIRHDTLRVILFKISTETIPSGDTSLISLEYSTGPNAFTRDVSLRLFKISVVDNESKALADLVPVDGLVRIEGKRPDPGDSDCNGRVDIFDLLETLQVLSGKRQDRHLFNDLDGNGKIDIFDLLRMLRILSGHG